MENRYKKVVILLAHPKMDESQGNKALVDSVADMEDVAVYNLYAMQEEQVLDVEEWNKVISHANAVVYQFPFYWLSAPSLLKKWQDEVFIALANTPTVAGKPLLVATTTGSDADAYRSGGRNRFTVDELLRPYQGSAIHSGMVWQTPIVVYGMGSADSAKNIAEGVALYKHKIEALAAIDGTENKW
jgi:glutathione-regulated potassium-efflux system ancillary protein KefG